MANFEIVALDPTTPQLRAPGAADGYTLPRPINGRNINYTVENINSVTFTLDPTRNGRVIIYTGSAVTATVPSAIGFDVGFNVWIINNTTSSIGVLTLSSASTIDGQATFLLNRGDGIQLVATVAGGWEIVGGRKPRGYAENINASTTRASATGDRAIAIGAIASASGLYSIAHGYLASAGNTAAIALGYNANASGTYACAIFGTAGANYQTSIGYNSAGSQSVTATGAGAVAIGGSYASGVDSFAAAVGNNTNSYGATGANSIAIGFQSIANSSYAVSIGWANTAGNRSICIGGNTSSALDNSVCIGSWSSTISGAYSATLGGGKASDRSQQNRWAYGTLAAPAAGNAQLGVFILYRQTADATPTALLSNSAASATVNNIPVLADQCAYAFTGTVIAKQSGSTNAASWKIEGMIVRGAGAGTTTLVASTVTVISNVPGWNLALSADTTNGGLLVTATGAAATNIRWVANIQSSEVVYA